MRINKRLYKIAICFLVIALLSGCGTSRELNELGIVIGVGIDKEEESDAVKITTQVVKPGQVSSGGKGGGGGEEAYANFEETGRTVFAAIRGIANKSSRKMYFPHNQVIIIGQNAAKDGVTKYLDFFMRDPETRLNVYLLVAKDTAAEVLETKSKLERVPGNSISLMLDSEANAASQAIDIRLRDFKESLQLKTVASVAPIIEVSEENGKKTATLNGTAVFKGDKMVGTLDKSEGRGLMWVLGKVKSGIIEVECSNGNLVALETVRAKGEFSSELVDGKVKIKVKISEEGNIGEDAGTEDISTLDEVAFLEQQNADVIKSEVMAAVKKAEELDADIFGFGESVHRKYPKEWTSMEDKWDEIFPTIEVEVEVEAKLRLMGRINAPSVPQ
ncbi:MAG: Ger(x)C family spore germination protein [Firmicutes bacterium HGW-Firmicutes-16]|nr:MAG: Ger(x)C family spore germination protein [Firmicutes bacterium HGW-Firmicutes-16]